MSTVSVFTTAAFRALKELKEGQDIDSIVSLNWSCRLVSEGRDNDKFQIKDDIGLTLTGMMGAMAEIQARGDKMVAAITNQRKVLDQLERRTEEVQQRRLGLEEASRELEGNRTTLELEISQLKEKKKDMEESMKTNEQKLSR